MKYVIHCDFVMLLGTVGMLSDLRRRSGEHSGNDRPERTGAFTAMDPWTWLIEVQDLQCISLLEDVEQPSCCMLLCRIKLFARYHDD